MITKIRHSMGSQLRKRLRDGKFYRIPFGPARGQYIEFHSGDNLDILFGFHEPNTFEVFRQLVTPGMVVADVGANHGYFSVFLGKLVAPGGVVYAFEPVPNTYAVLKRTLEKNTATCVKPICAAVTDRNQPVTFYLSHSHYMASLDATWANTPDATIEVQGVRLDTFFQQEGKWPGLIKMDIEGGGVFALDGMQSLIVERQPFLLLESHTPEEDRAIGRSLALADYAVFRVGSREPVTDLTNDYTNPNGVWGTVLGIPQAKLAVLPKFDPERFQRQRLGQRNK